MDHGLGSEAVPLTSEYLEQFLRELFSSGVSMYIRKAVYTLT